MWILKFLLEDFILKVFLKLFFFYGMVVGLGIFLLLVLYFLYVFRCMLFFSLNDFIWSCCGDEKKLCLF